MVQPRRERKSESAKKKGVEFDAESTEEADSSDRVRTSSKCDRVKKDRVDRNMKARTRTWYDMVKGLKDEDELETTNSDKSGNESEATDSVELFDSEELNHMKAE